MLGDRAQDARATHALVHALRTHGTTRPKRSVGRPDRCAHVWNGRGGETETSGAATRQVKVCDPRNPRYSVARRLAAGEFITSVAEQSAEFGQRGFSVIFGLQSAAFERLQKLTQLNLAAV